MKRLLVSFVFALIVHAGVALAVWDAYHAVKPGVECVQPLGDGTFVAYFGYLNREELTLTIEHGERNQLSDNAMQQEQPTEFKPGRTDGYPDTAFRVQFAGSSVTWTLEGQEATATPYVDRLCEPVQQKKLDLQKLELKKPEPKPEPKPEKKAPPKKKEEPKLEPKKDPGPKPKPKPRRGQPKRKKKPKAKKKAPPKKAEPAPLVLKNVMLEGPGVNVQAGEEDIFGDPTLEANENNTRIDEPDDTPDEGPKGEGGPVVVEPEKKKPPKIVFPKIKAAVSGKYPSDAPRLGRVVKVRLSLRVGPDGKVKKVKVVKGAGGAFDREARRVAFKLVFHPGKRDGKRTSMSVPWTVEFHPED